MTPGGEERASWSKWSFPAKNGHEHVGLDDQSARSVGPVGKSKGGGGTHGRRPGPTGAVRGALGDPTGGVPDRQGPYGVVWETPQGWPKCSK